MSAHVLFHRGVLRIGLMVCLTATIGCAKPSKEQPESKASVPQGSQLASGQQSADTGRKPEVKLTTADITAYEGALRQHVGKVILVDFWATWCVPCKKNFPKTLAYGREFADQGLAVVSVSFDDESAQAEVLDFLTSVQAEIPNLISAYGAGTESTERFAVDSALPYYKLYDRQGKLRYQFSDVPEGLDHLEGVERIHQRIEELLAEE